MTLSPPSINQIQDVIRHVVGLDAERLLDDLGGAAAVWQ
jgi:hypothetical protein